MKSNTLSISIFQKKGSVLGPYTSYLIGILSSSAFVTFVEELTGISGLVADPHLGFAGIMQYRTGGSLELHTDFHYSNELKMYRRVNLLLYLNKDWREEYNGHLELWDAKLQKSVKYLPTLNRMIIANIGPHAYHGVPEPIACPENMTRKSLAIWYYTSDLPQDVKLAYEVYKPDWVRRPESVTLWEKITPPIFYEFRDYPGRVVAKFLPPALVNHFRRGA